MTPKTIQFAFEAGEAVLCHACPYVVLRRRYLDSETSAAVEYLTVPQHWHYAQHSTLEFWVTAETLQPIPPVDIAQSQEVRT